MIYFDQAASSFPKPPEVEKRMLEAINKYGANPGRGAHKLAKQASSIIEQTREKLTFHFGCNNPNHCIFLHNATTALNQAIKGLNWKKGDHIIASTFEHNSVRRPLEHIRKKYGVDITFLQYSGDDDLFVRSFEKSITKRTKLVVMTHASNVTGIVLPINKITPVAKENNIITLIDASQTAGHIDIDMVKQNIDMLAFPAHKGLLGPQGVGILLIEGEIPLEPIHHGGTGAFSERIDQPNEYPEKLESGTLNTPGIAGLLGALENYEKRKEEIVSRETFLVEKLLSGLRQIPGVLIYSNFEQYRVPIVAFNIENTPSQEIAMILDSHYNIAVRAGLHCSPLTHQTIDTIEQGAVRASINMYNTEEEIAEFLNAIREIAQSYEMI